MAVGRRTFLASTMASLAAPAVIRAAHGEAAAPHFTFKLHHADSSVSCAHTNFLVPWAHSVEQQSEGRLRIDIFPSMALGGQPAELFDQARDRIADIVWAMPSKTPGRFPKSELFELPFVASRRALVSSKAIEDFASGYLQDEFREVRPICFSCADRGILHANRPVRTVGEAGELRLDVRTRFAAETVQALGGSAVPMPSGQLPLAIARRVVDGCIVPWDMVPALKLDQLLNAHTDFADYSLSTTTYVLAMNPTAYDKLPADLKKILDDNSGQVAAGMAGAMWDLKADAVADAVTQRGGNMITLEPQAVAHWRKAIEPVVGNWLKEMKSRKIDGDRLLASAHALLAKYVNEPEPKPPAPPRPQAVQQPVEARIENPPPAKVEATAPAPAQPAKTAAPAPQPKVNAVTPAPRSASPTHWWQFWKPSATASTTPVAPAPQTHWWEFWKSSSPPAPATAHVAPAAPPTALPVPATPAAPPQATAVLKPAPAPPHAAAVLKPAPTPPSLSPASPPPSKTLNIPL
jgi:TRAP-type transport system periplasmic protein